MPDPIVISPRFCGPADRGNGGVTAGLLAAAIPGPAEVTLRRPSPLATPLEAVSDGGTVVLRAGDDVIAEAIAADVAVDAPPAVPLAEARAAAAASPVVVHPEWHPFPSCFVCGPGRAEGDGLRVFPGRLAPREVFAAPVVYPRDLGDTDGFVPAHLLWAALDCPSSFVMYMDGTRPTAAYVLGRIAARIDRRPPIESHLVVCSWPLGVDGRKLFAASALYQSDELIAVARATWISV